MPSPATLSFVTAESNRYAAISGGRVEAIYGLKEDSEYSLSETDDFVAGFLAQNDDAFGVDDLTVDAASLRKLDLRDGRFRLYTYTQTILDIPVHAGTVNVLVYLGDAGASRPDRITYLGLQLVTPPDPPAMGCIGGPTVTACFEPFSSVFTTNDFADI